MARSHAAPDAVGRAVGTGSAAGAGSGAGSTGPDEVQALLVDIFTLTGQKVQKDDPLVAAALIHSALLRRAGDDAARAIAQAAQVAREDTERSARAQQLAAGGLQRALRWLGHWHAQAMLATALFVICFAASALGTLLASTSCH